MDGRDIAHNKAVRGYIMRSLAKGFNNTLLCRQLVNVMISDGIIVSPDISKHLDYLVNKGYIEFTNKKVNSYTAYANDATIRLTVDGVDLLEGSRPDDPGVDI
ncbi:hypothetical protein [Brevibacillus agri]|uniref:hypothetical protein n=1 Tax=Brevibacillus agri TaxID=51101 RepID=UPI0018CC7D01|nr:hypothetical protein [Brevibacillus agri]MBG9567452.1 hypothetical protein [Brevibacillus agri]MDR9503397.1 hypothetical protein [Brevibacillus agri]